MKHELSEEDQILRDALIAHRSAEMASAEAAKRKRRASKRVGTGEVVERAIPKPTGRRYKSVDALVRGECSKKFQCLFFALRRTQSGKRPNNQVSRGAQTTPDFQHL